MCEFGWFLVVHGVFFYDFGWFLVVPSGSLMFLLALGPLKFLVLFWCLLKVLGGSYYFFVVLCGSLWFLMVLGGSWFFLVVLGDFCLKKSLKKT